MTLKAKIALTAMSLAGLVLSLGMEASSPVSARSPAPALTTVTFDFQTGIKTTFYSDGTVFEDGFDPARMRKLATRPTP